MVELPPEYVINQTLSVGRIYKLYAPEIVNITIPHYFIVVAIDGDDNYMLVGTTKREKKEKHFENMGLDLSGLVCISSDSQNCLPEETWVNCNDHYHITKDDLVKKVELKSFEITGEVSLDHYFQLRAGIIGNDNNDLPEYLLVHPLEDENGD
jgi:hypothetical protein